MYKCQVCKDSGVLLARSRKDKTYQNFAFRCMCVKGISLNKAYPEWTKEKEFDFIIQNPDGDSYLPGRNRLDIEINKDGRAVEFFGNVGKNPKASKIEKDDQKPAQLNYCPDDAPF